MPPPLSGDALLGHPLVCIGEQKVRITVHHVYFLQSNRDLCELAGCLFCVLTEFVFQLEESLAFWVCTVHISMSYVWLCDVEAAVLKV